MREAGRDVVLCSEVEDGNGASAGFMVLGIAAALTNWHEILLTQWTATSPSTPVQRKMKYK
jgi:hypothetical protein